MSDMIRLDARSDETDPARAVNEAMRRLVAQMVPLGLAPADLVAMAWMAEHPAAFHPGRRPIHLAAREAISGFLPPVTLVPGGPGLSVTAMLAAPRPATAGASSATWCSHAGPSSRAVITCCPRWA